MRAVPDRTVRVGFWCRRDGAGVRDCVGQRVRAEGAGGDRGLHAQRLDQLREDQAGRWLRPGLFAVRLEARRLHLRPQARRHSRGRQVGDRARRVRARRGPMRSWPSRAGSTPRSICGATSPSTTPAKRTRFQCAAFHLTRDGAKPQDGYLCVTVLEQQVRQAPPHHA